MIRNTPLEIKVLYEQTCGFPLNDSLWQEIIKVREGSPHIGLIPKVIPMKLFFVMVHSSLVYVTRALGVCFHGGSVFVSCQREFRFF